MEIKTIWKIVSGLSVFGILLAIYLLFEQITHSSSQICSINSTVNCDAIITGAASKVFGISTPFIGLVGYIFILISSISRKKKTTFIMSVFGLLFCLWIFYQETFLIHTICLICILCQITMISIFIFSIMLQKGGK